MNMVYFLPRLPTKLGLLLCSRFEEKVYVWNDFLTHMHIAALGGLCSMWWNICMLSFMANGITYRLHLGLTLIYICFWYSVPLLPTSSVYWRPLLDVRMEMLSAKVCETNNYFRGLWQIAACWLRRVVTQILYATWRLHILSTMELMTTSTFSGFTLALDSVLRQYLALFFRRGHLAWLLRQ